MASIPGPQKERFYEKKYVVELIAVVLILYPPTTWLGAFLALGTMAGAIMSHLTQLGIVVKDDGGLLFILAIVVFLLGHAAFYKLRRSFADVV